MNNNISMRREELVRQLDQYNGTWDICIIGGGASGLGIAVDAASRGYKTVLLEKFDFAKGTSSRSTSAGHSLNWATRQGCSHPD